MSVTGNALEGLNPNWSVSVYSKTDKVDNGARFQDSVDKVAND